ncbi:hypothetical protein EI555_010493 [Monodon monoceros]|uniref:Uncharacterized protein n=1 Tax=Monodon monoceros TaxID=40151 RepID=A0A4U1FEE5_MONMO|nr:hypothetical protein EI555_010493 [Monodon monoceros]
MERARDRLHLRRTTEQHVPETQRDKKWWKITEDWSPAVHMSLSWASHSQTSESLTLSAVTAKTAGAIDLLPLCFIPAAQEKSLLRITQAPGQMQLQMITVTSLMFPLGHPILTFPSISGKHILSFV